MTIVETMDNLNVPRRYVAEQLGVTTDELLAWINGKRQPTEKQLINLLKALHEALRVVLQVLNEATKEHPEIVRSSGFWIWIKKWNKGMDTARAVNKTLGLRKEVDTNETK